MLEHPELIKIGEAEIKVEGFTQTIQEAYEKHMQLEYLGVIKTNKAVLGNDYLDMLHKHFCDVKNGSYNFGGQKFFDFVSILPHFVELIWWCCSKHQQIAKEDVAAWIEANADEAGLLFGRLIESKKK